MIPHRQPLTIYQGTAAALLRQLGDGHALVPERRLSRLQRAWTRVRDDPSPPHLHRALQLSVSALRTDFIERCRSQGIPCERGTESLSYVLGGEASAPRAVGPGVLVQIHDATAAAAALPEEMRQLKGSSRFVGWGAMIQPVAHYLDAGVAMFSDNAMGWHLLYQSASDAEIVALRARDAWPMHITFESTPRASVPGAHPFILFVHDYVDSLQLSSWPRSVRMYLARLAPICQLYPHTRQLQGSLIARSWTLESPGRWSGYRDVEQGDLAPDLAAAFFQPWIQALLRNLEGAATLRARVNDALDETPLQETALRAFDIALGSLIARDRSFQELRSRAS